MTSDERIAAAEALLVDRIFHAQNTELLEWTQVYCHNPFPEGRARDIQAMLGARRARLHRIAPIWC